MINISYYIYGIFRKLKQTQNGAGLWLVMMSMPCIWRKFPKCICPTSGKQTKNNCRPAHHRVCIGTFVQSAAAPMLAILKMRSPASTMCALLNCVHTCTCIWTPRRPDIFNVLLFCYDQLSSVVIFAGSEILC